MKSSLVSLLVPLVLAGCGEKVAPVSMAGTGPTVVPAANLYLRNAFDTDPSVYIGRFVPEGMTAVDESSAMRSACSEHITWRRVEGGGVVYDELFSASTEAAARVGVPAVVGVDLSGSTASVVRVRYELTGKMVADVSDPAAFEACCKRAPDQCTARYVGEFLEGKGAVFYSTGRAASGSASGVASGVAGDLDVKHGMAWQRSVEFPNPVFFALKTTENRFHGEAANVAAAGCGDWVSAPPKSSQGQYFVGVSDPLDSERVAREAALLDARVQVVRWAEQAITSGTLRTERTEGAMSGLTTTLQEERMLEAAAQGVSNLVKDENWCVETVATPGGPRYTAKVLAFLPKAVEEQAADAVLGATVP